MRAILALTALLLISTPLPAQEVLQSDWHGGDGVAGPVTDWADQFDTSSGVSWMSVQGQLALSSSALMIPPEYLITDSYTGTIGVGVGDIDGDGDMDVVGTADASGMVLFFENEGGDPITWAEHVLDQSVNRGPIAVRAADLDGDGDLDPVGALYDTGEYVWWKATEFHSSGELTASILDTGAKSSLASIDWTALDPVGTSLRFQVRSSNDPGDLGNWSADITSPGNLPGLMDWYIQYRVFLETTDADKSPVLGEVSFGPPAAAVEVTDSGARIRPLAIRPNSFNPQATVSFGLEAREHVRLAIFDAEGRRVREMANRVLPAGDHHLSWDGVDDYGRALQSGVYFIRMESPSRRTSEKLILLR